MKGLACVLWLLPAAAFATDGSPRFHVATGVGAPELVHGEIGFFATPRLSVDVRAANAALNPMIGTGVTYLIGGAPEGDSPRHALMLRLHGMLNPTLGGLRLTSTGDTFGAYVQPGVGYGFLAGNGFTLRASVGLVVAAERFDSAAPPETLPAPPFTGVSTVSTRRAEFGLQLGPQANLSLGWAF